VGTNHLHNGFFSLIIFVLKFREASSEFAAEGGMKVYFNLKKK
jgi:hypothetical protein